MMLSFAFCSTLQRATGVACTRNAKKTFIPVSASPFMDQIPLKERVYTINGIIHDFVIKNEKFFPPHSWDVF